jgi:RNA polymerase sigma-70 factor (ECF subfamily)
VDSLGSAAESSVHLALRRRRRTLSFRDVYRAHHAYVWRCLLRLGVDDAAVDDAVQDVFIVVHRKLDDFEGRAQIKTWLFAIARRVALRYRDRAKRKQHDDECGDETASPTGNPDVALSHTEALRRLQDWLDELDDDKRVVFVLSEFEQMRAPEIADMLDVNVNTVYARLRAARQHVSRRARRDANLESFRPVVQLSARRGPEPEASRRTWVLLCGELGIGKAATGGGSLLAGGAFAKFTLAASLVGGTSLAAVAVVEPHPEPQAVAVADMPTSPASHKVSAPPAPPTHRSGAISEILSPVPAPFREVSEPEGDARTQPELLSPSLIRSLEGSVSKARRTTKAPPAVAPAQANDPSGTARVVLPDPMFEEVRLFERAKLAAREGRAGDALRLLDLYRQRYPAGGFAEEADALRVRALCKAYRKDEAKQAAIVFARRHPGSKLVSPDTPCR